MTVYLLVIIALMGKGTPVERTVGVFATEQGCESAARVRLSVVRAADPSIDFRHACLPARVSE